MTEQLHFHFSLSCIGEGNGNPLQCSCLENPRDGGAWWAAIYRVTQSRTQLKQLSSSSSRYSKWIHNIPIDHFSLQFNLVNTICFILFLEVWFLTANEYLYLVTLTLVSSGSDCSLQLTKLHVFTATWLFCSIIFGFLSVWGWGFKWPWTADEAIYTPCQVAAFFLCHCLLMFFIHALPVF